MTQAYGYGRSVSDVVPADPDPGPWGLRASDADRQAYLQVLQDAYLEGRLTKPEYDERMEATLSAVTYADLAPLLRDLPVPADLPGPPLPTVQRPREWATGSTTVSGQAPLLALFSEISRDSRWTVAEGQTVVAAFGSAKLDLTQAQVESADTELRANAVFGEVTIIVPGDLEVEVSGVGIFGEFTRKDKRSMPTEPSGRPRIRITGVALFGAVTVRVVDEPVTRTDRVLPPPQGPPAVGPGTG